MPLILGRPFLKTVHAVVDLSYTRISFSSVDKKVFYNAVPTDEVVELALCLTIEDEENLDVMKTRELGDKNGINDVLDGDTHSSIRMFMEVKKREKAKIERVTGYSHVTFVPQRYVWNTI